MWNVIVGLVCVLAGSWNRDLWLEPIGDSDFPADDLLISQTPVHISWDFNSPVLFAFPKWSHSLSVSLKLTSCNFLDLKKLHLLLLFFQRITITRKNRKNIPPVKNFNSGHSHVDGDQSPAAPPPFHSSLLLKSLGKRWEMTQVLGPKWSSQLLAFVAIRGINQPIGVLPLPSL